MNGDETKGARQDAADAAEPSCPGEGEAKGGLESRAGIKGRTPPDEGVGSLGCCFEPGIPAGAGLDHRCAPTRICR